MATDDAQGEIELALRLLDEGDYGHATHHLSGVAADNPLDPRLQRAIEQLCDAVDEPAALVELGERPYLGNVVLRALIDARFGRFEDALCRLIGAEQHAPAGAYLAAIRADGLSDAALRTVDAERVGAAFAAFASATDEMKEPERSEALGRAFAWCEILLLRHEASEGLTFAACMLMRRMDRGDEVIELCERFLRDRSSYKVSICVANVLRDRDEHREAIAMYRQAAALEPSDYAVWLDIGDVHADHAELSEAVAAYGEALAREPEQPWGRASLHYYRYVLEDRPEDLDVLGRLAAAEPPDRRARELHYRATVFERFLSARPEASLKALGRGAATLGISSLEAPSAIAIVRLLEPQLVVSMGETQGVDPRLPRRKVKLCLWRYQREGPWPWSKVGQRAEVVPHGSTAHAEPIRALAASRYDARTWFERAGDVAKELGPNALDVCAATMVSFTSGPQGFALQDWVFHCQVAAAFVIAHLPDGEAALWDLVYGPVDWVGTAAVTALTQIAITKPNVRERIVSELLAQLHAVDNPIGYMTLTLPVAQNLMRVPDLATEWRERARAVRNADC